MSVKIGADAGTRQLEFLFAFVADGIGKLTIECDFQVLHPAVDAEMDAFHRLAARGDVIDAASSRADREATVAEERGQLCVTIKFQDHGTNTQEQYRQEGHIERDIKQCGAPGR
jgi:hypothetical protein